MLPRLAASGLVSLMLETFESGATVYLAGRHGAHTVRTRRGMYGAHSSANHPIRQNSPSITSIQCISQPHLHRKHHPFSQSRDAYQRPAQCGSGWSLSAKSLQLHNSLHPGLLVPVATHKAQKGPKSSPASRTPQKGQSRRRPPSFFCAFVFHNVISDVFLPPSCTLHHPQLQPFSTQPSAPPPPA